MKGWRNDVGFTHVALMAKSIDESVSFYSRYAKMEIVHERVDESMDNRVVWLSDNTRPFVLVLVESEKPEPILAPFAHLGVGCGSKDQVDLLCKRARQEGALVKAPVDSGYPVGYWAFLSDPDGHILELSYGQEIGFTVEGTDQP